MSSSFARIASIIRNPAFLKKGNDARFLCTGLSTSSPPLDYLSNDLRRAQNSATILDMIGQHHRIMNGQQVVQALRSIFTLQREGHSHTSTHTLIKHPNFERLCTRLKWHARTIELNEALDALKTLSYVGVPADAEIMQILLQIIRHSINDLSLKQIIFLDFLLNQCKRSALLDAILIALPIVFEINLPLKMDRTIVQLVNYLQYAAQRNLHANTVQLLAEEIERAWIVEEMDARSAMRIVRSLCDLSVSGGGLMERALQVVGAHADELSFNEMEMVLFKLGGKRGEDRDRYYDATYLNVCAEKVIAENLGLTKAVNILQKLIRFKHANNNLLNYACVKLEENAACAEPDENRMRTLNVIVEGLALTEYRPTNIEFVRNFIGNTHFTEYKGILWTQLAASLCVLRIANAEVLNVIFEPTFLHNILKKQIVYDYANLLTVNQTIYSYFPRYIEMLPAQDVIDSVALHMKPEDYPLEGALKMALGGKEYILSGVYTHLGQHIDHVFAIRKGGYPIAFSQEHIKYVEEAIVPPESEIIVVLLLRAVAYTRNKRLRGSTHSTIDILERSGYNVVAIDWSTFDALYDREKIPYLMRAINEKTSLLQLSVDENVH